MLTDKNINFNKIEFDLLTQNLENKPDPLEVFDYCYGILNDINYRKQFNEFLRRDYPKVPVIKNQEMLNKYSNAGKKLRELHLMKTNTQKELELESINNNLIIDKIKYTNGKLQINSDTSIIGITEEIYNYYLGGYQVIDKWFKSHKGETLTIEAFTHIKKITGIIEETIKIQQQLIAN